MSALPKAVQKQIEEANRLAEQLNKERLDAKAPPPDGQPPASDQGAPPPAASGEPAQPAGTPPAAPAPADGWEQKYKVLQGKNNAEVPRLQRTVNEQSTAIAELRQQLVATQTMFASLGQNRGAAPGAAAPAPAGNGKLVEDEEVREYGEDLTDYIRRVAQDAVLPKVSEQIQPMRQQVEQVRNVAGQVMQRSAQTDQEKMFALLDAQVEGWQQQNEDGQFLEWLQLPDTYSGVKRMDLLKQAYERFDGPRVVAFFKGYRNEHAVVTPPAAAAPAQGAPQRKLEEFVAPGSAKAGTTGAQDGAGKRIWTQAEIKQFYDDCAAGKYRSPHGMERKKQIEQDIFAASREGRVR
jgi:hypothetical protein